MTVPAECPPNQFFVIPRLYSSVIHWAHACPFACHPGSTLTLFLIQQRFWWETMNKDVAEYVSSCQMRDVRPWLHISLDFVTGLPVSHGNNTILTIVDRFSKMAQFVLLPKISQ